MKRISILALIFALMSCATPSAQRHPADIYSSQNKSLAESGQLKWSDYYIGLYDSMQSKPSYTTGDELIVINGLIDSSYDLESNKITKPEFESKRREARAKFMKIDSDFQLKRQEIEAQRPVVVQPPPTPYIRKPQTTNCNTYGNNTTCTTY